MKYYSNGNEIIKLIVRLGDFVLLNIVLLFFYNLKSDIVPVFFHNNIKMIILIANFSMFLAQNFITPIIHQRITTFEKIFTRVFKLTIIQSATLFFFTKLITEAGGFFHFLLFYVPTLFLAIFLLRGIEWFILKRARQLGINTRSILFVGDDPANILVFREMASDPSTGYKVRGYYAEKQMEDCPESLRYLGNISDLKDFINNAEEGNNIHIDEIFCSLSQDESETIVKIMQYCDKHITHFFYVPRQFGNFRLNLKPQQFGDQTIFTNHQEPLASPGNRFIKRSFDIIFSLIVCIVLLPFIPIIALIIKKQSPGPILFKQARTGLNGKTFTCYKFRSMHVNDNADMQQATLDDPRKFPFGNFMRKCNIDEFPQFYNVLIGDMSIVGPRPHMLHHTEVYSSLIDKYMVRHFSKPGITGYAQVTGYRGETKELWQMEERIRRDIWYIENWTFWLDIKIIFLTFTSLFIPDKKAY